MSEESVEMKYAPLVHVWVAIGGVDLVISCLNKAEKGELSVDNCRWEIQMLINIESIIFR
jgi:hypothetical protein